jgi:hypothetical protein
MKKFILKGILFFLVMVSVAYSLDYAISSGLKQMQDYRFQTWNDIVNSKINADVIVMGNSRAFSHYVPSVFDSVLQVNSYNLGIGGHPFNVQYLRYKLYEEHNTKPALIIQNIDFLTLNQSVIGHEREQIFPFVSDCILRNNLQDYGFTFGEIYFPLYRYFGYPMVIKNGLFEFFGFKHYNSQSSYKGYRPETGNWDDTELNKLKTIEPDMNPVTIRLFDEFLSHCKMNNIQVVLVNSPIYYKATLKLNHKEQYNSLIKGFSKKYNIPYFDYTNDPICNDSTLFHVAVHLNQQGAEKFSTKLANDIKLYLKPISKK